MARNGERRSRRGPHRGEATIKETLADRYARAYGAAYRLKAVAVLLAVAGVLIILAGVGSCAGMENNFEGYFRGDMGASFILWGSAALMTSLVLNAIGSILACMIDRSVFAAPGLTDEQRLEIVFEAGGEDPQL